MSINKVIISGNLTREERWKWIKGYEGLYTISDQGRVMGMPKKTHCGHIMKKGKIWSGYEKVSLCKNNLKRCYSVHRLVAKAFISNSDNKPEVNHKNGDRADNRAENLEWVTRGENEKHAYRTLGKKPNAPWRDKPNPNLRKFTPEQVIDIRSDNRPYRVIGADYGVSKTAIRDIKTKKNYKEVV